MPLERFQKLRRFIHFNDNTNITDQTKDRHFKIRPLLEIVLKNCTYAGNLRQYILNKPHKWGLKFFIRTGVSGYIADFILYQGAATFEVLKGSPNEVDDYEVNLGVGTSAVISLYKTLSEPINTVIFCDNWFSSVKLFIYQKDRFGILSLGTIRSNRIAGCQLETDKCTLVCDSCDMYFLGYRNKSDFGTFSSYFLDSFIYPHPPKITLAAW
ncbi:unnamed protein product [Acanthoscelides obtectus]|uniref:PiggyBac transposable element-derived protein domain-containing protein n=1 Tax=Acanthoscelides obtectus TaxID=200917 RepID=A0A9P0P8U9_ACAOB|nr:unnamed protein product [Acanthoscelides obtectus]CAK1685448.1 PiggyBac transposable element-derived protein 1 [Acanthoscelides obtectus]